MKDKGIAHIGIGVGKGDDKALEAVKMAVESPLLESTITGATHIILNISGEISLTDADDAAEYVRSLTGEDVNLIFGAMYDEGMSDGCKITVIATGIEGEKQERKMPGIGGFKPHTPAPVGPENTGTGEKPVVTPFTGIHKPDVRATVTPKTLDIPTFLQKK